MEQTIKKKYKDLFQHKEYRFLREDENLNNNIGYLTLGGSRAYGTNTPTSDVDIRGFYFNKPDDILSLKEEKKEEVENKETDTVVYSLKKFLSLLMNCNPNVIEMLGTREEDVILQTETSKYLRDNFELFLSKKAYATFGGYATAQLRRLENALARDSYPQAEKEKHILKSLEAEMFMAKDLFKGYGEDNKLHLFVDESKKEDLDTEIFLDVNLSHIPLRDFLRINAGMNNMLRNYGKLNKRNSKKDEPHLLKHAMHLIRLYLMGIDVLKKHEIVTYRPEHELLMSIRNGEKSFKEIFALQKELEKEFKSAYKESTLPDEPNYTEINNFFMNTMAKNIKSIF